MRRFFLAAVLLLGCPSSDPPPEEPPPVSSLTLADWTNLGSLGVGELQLDLEDTSRETPAHGTFDALPSRSLPTTVWYPATEGHALQPSVEAPPAEGTFPLVVISHGFMSGASDHAGLAAFLASHGYVVANIEFPLSSRNAPGEADAADAINQPEDVSFVLDEILGLTDGPVAGLVDDRIATGGLSMGGLTTLAVGLHPAVKDDRIDALIAMAPATCSLGLDIFDVANPPLLLMHGSSDQILPIDAHIPPLTDGLTGPWWLATLAEGTHAGFPDAAAGLLDNLDHADTLGCGQLDLGDAESPATDQLDGEGGVLDPDCVEPCADLDDLLPGMKPSRQVDLSFGLAHAFLDAQFYGDAEGTLWLETGVGAQEPDVAVTFAP